MTGAAATLLSILTITSFVMIAGGLWTIFRRRDRKRGLLMLLVAAVMMGNVLILIA